jgi:hypothetical protein
MALYGGILDSLSMRKVGIFGINLAPLITGTASSRHPDALMTEGRQIL